MPDTPCPHCAFAQAHGRCATYSFYCLECCARLVFSTYPLKPQAASMLACIARHKKAPKRSDILRRVKEKIAQHNQTGLFS